MAKKKTIKVAKNVQVSNAKKPEGNKPWLPWCVATLILMVTYLVFSPCLNNGFTNWDDGAYVSNNHLVVQKTIPLKEIFTTPVEANYHPLTMLTLAFNYQSGQLNPEGYHAWNLILHLLNTLLVFIFIYGLTKSNLLMAAIVSLFFGIHPMHVESVAWISERKDVLYVFFFLAGLVTYLRYRNTKKWIWYLLTLFLFILSCLSKGMAVVFPVILLLVDYVLEVKWERKIFLEKIPFFLLSLAFGITAWHFQHTGMSSHAVVYSVVNRLLFASYGAVMYVAKFFIPAGLSAFYPYPALNKVLPAMLIYPAIIIALVVFVYLFLRKEKAVVFGLLFYFISIVFVLQFITIGSVIIAERYSYLSYIGLLFPVAWLINKALHDKNTFVASLKYPLTLLLVAAAFMFGFQTYDRTQVWENGETLWTDVINKYPTLYRGYEKRGEYYQEKEDYDKALPDLSNAIRFFPFDSRAYNNRGMIYYRQGKNDSALADFNNAIKYSTEINETSSAYGNRANVYMRTGKNNLAENDFAKALAADSLSHEPVTATLLALRGNYYGHTNQFEKAIADFSSYLKLKPNDDVIYNFRGICYNKLDRNGEALPDYTKAIQLNPSVPNYWLNRSFSENALAKKEEAKADALKAQQLGMQVDTNYLKSLGL